MQMAKTAQAVGKHDQAGLLFISVLTHLTVGGVYASFASLGDIILAEPGASIGFAGPRIVVETTRQKLPPGFQTSEYALKNGMIDAVKQTPSGQLSVGC
jgi:acetyl-CoA carboxylase carboxyl transferase subunit beta